MSAVKVLNNSSSHLPVLAIAVGIERVTGEVIVMIAASETQQEVINE